MSTHFRIVDGVLKAIPFVGPIQVIVKEKPRFSDIAMMLPDYENVSETTLIRNNLVEQQKAAASSLDKPEVIANAIAKKSGRKVKIRRFTYSNVSEVLAKGYWHTEKRSLTRYASNSLMFEFKAAQSR